MLNKINKTAQPIPPYSSPSSAAKPAQSAKSSPKPQAKPAEATYTYNNKNITLNDIKTPQAILAWIWNKYPNKNTIKPAELEIILTGLTKDVTGLSLEDQYTLNSNVEALINLTSPLKKHEKYKDEPIIAVLYKTIKNQTPNATNNVTPQNIQSGYSASGPDTSNSIISNIIHINPDYYPSAAQFLQSVDIMSDQTLNIKQYKYSENPKQDAARMFGTATVPKAQQYQAWHMVTGFTEAPLTTTTTPNASKREYLVWDDTSKRYKVFGSIQTKQGYEVNTNDQFTLEQLTQKPMFAKVKSLIDNMALNLSITRMVEFIKALQSDISNINNRAPTYAETFKVEQQIIIKWCTEWYNALNNFRILLLKPGRNEI